MELEDGISFDGCPINFCHFYDPQPGGEMAEYDLVGVIIAKNGLKTPKMRI